MLAHDGLSDGGLVGIRHNWGQRLQARDRRRCWNGLAMGNILRSSHHIDGVRLCNQRGRTLLWMGSAMGAEAFDVRVVPG